MPDVAGHKASKAATYREVARIHAACINMGFLLTLGERFLSLLYEAIDADPSSVLFVEIAEGEVVGFVAGGSGMGPIYRQMLKRWPRLIWSLFPALMNPMKLKRIIEIVWFSRRQKSLPGSTKAELFSIAVQEKARGRGVAERLYQSLMQWFAQQGEASFCIVVGASLATAHRFYLKMGAVPIAEISVHQGQVSTLYRHDLHIEN